ncbi:hypothetical protein ASPWEDRAFT_115688 [Aspergillus wentii DTO 134E9]|uniref:cutinase n=1 Tax=Aspergillus wentii DTO 134E9 TaxID=1073089 RepID=A0A1L9RF54_ASPWE|nr:uncharacterized protein ASPWEDRAFT_115688 [Aspergillus wentii DTO 134E9]KAI9926226.1 hypothetical protein MW887_004689 [Aspergillus wentii]OJJ33552.1 hypothetical protein ASPWEDRAFT_115688 [Aspergillus wentii DTO 134E9]
MLFHSLLALLFVPLVAANPVPSNETSIIPRNDTSIRKRQFISANDLDIGGCKDVMFIFARGSTEIGNMGSVVGPEVCVALKGNLGADKVGCQGVGGAYTAGLVENALPQSTAPQAIWAATSYFKKAASKCPNMKIVAGGYSQGSAVIDNSVQSLSSDIKSKVVGVVLFGFTRNFQDHGQIPNYPKDQVKVYCALGDLVCDNTLIITPSHLTYGINAGDAASFLASKVKSSS